MPAVHATQKDLFPRELLRVSKAYVFFFFFHGFVCFTTTRARPHLTLLFIVNTFHVFAAPSLTFNCLFLRPTAIINYARSDLYGYRLVSCSRVSAGKQEAWKTETFTRLRLYN